MKTAWITIITIIIAGSAAGDALKETIEGGLLGAAAGVLVSEISDDYDASTTIPFFTGIGALTGYAIHQNRQDDRYQYDPYRHSRHHDYYLPYLALPYAWYSHRYPSRYYYYTTASLPTRQRTQPRVAPPPVGRHPGVTLIAVPVTLRNGTTVPISILKLGDRYVGPRGEAYETMPDANVLRQRYVP